MAGIDNSMLLKVLSKQNECKCIAFWKMRVKVPQRGTWFGDSKENDVWSSFSLSLRPKCKYLLSGCVTSLFSLPGGEWFPLQAMMSSFNRALKSRHSHRNPHPRPKRQQETNKMHFNQFYLNLLIQKATQRFNFGGLQHLFLTDSQWRSNKNTEPDV